MGNQMTMDQLTQFFAGVEFPAPKEELVQAARDNNAPEESIKRIEKLPEKEYQDLNDVQKSMMGEGGGKAM